MAYLGRTPSQATRSRYYFTASGGETSLSGNDSNGNTLTFTDGNFVDVNLNGATLVAGSDYNTTTANTIAGLAALAASDIVEIVVYDTFSVFGGNVLGDFTVSNGTLTAEAVAISSLSTTGNITFGDNDKAIFGAGSDLQIYHDGSNSYIDDVTGSGTGDLFIKASDAVRVLTTNFVVNNAANNENMITAAQDGAAKLFFNGSTKIATTNTGVDVTGTVTTDGLTVDGNARIEEVGAISKLTLERGGSANSADSAAVDLLETNSGSEGANFGDAATNGFRLKLDGSANDFLIQSGASGTVRTRLGVDRDTGDISFYEDTGTTAKLFWDASTERLGLGTSSPDSPLEIQAATNSSSDTTYLKLFNAGENVGNIDFENGNGSLARITGTKTGSGASANDGILTFSTALDTSLAERMRIDASGNLLVGTTDDNVTNNSGNNPGINIGVAGIKGFMSSARYQGPPLSINRLGNDGDIQLFSKDGSTVGSIGANGSRAYMSGPQKGIKFGNASVDPCTNTGATADNAYDLGGSSVRYKDLYLSGGVYLGGTAAANKLEDYEEGTFTPSVIGGTQTATIVSAHYTKIGRLVTLNVYIQLSNVTDATALDIGGFPFTADGYTATNIVNSQYSDTDKTVLVRSHSNATKVNVIYADGDQTAVVQTNLRGNFIFTLTYEQA